MPLDSENARASYEKWHREITAREHVDLPHAPWHELARRHLPASLAGHSVLEIGCGRGGFSEELARRGASLVAADFSLNAVEATTAPLQKWSATASAEVADIQMLPHSNDKFDVVISLETLEHVPDPEVGLAELVRVTRPGGKLIISTPNYFGLMGIYRWYREKTGSRWDEGGQPICHPLRLGDRVRQLRRFGCEVTAVEGCGHYLYVPRCNPVRIRALDWFGWALKRIAAHGFTVAVKEPKTSDC